MKQIFDISKYGFKAINHMWYMDELHVQMLRHALSIDIGIPASEKIAVEIGSFDGYSTTAFVDALNSGDIGHLHIVEVKVNESLRRIISLVKDKSKLTLHECPVWESKIKKADFIFIDGDHRWPAIADTLKAITLGAKIISYHDTRAFPKHGTCWGVGIASEILRKDPSRIHFEDCMDRPDMRTFRGFQVSSSVNIDFSVLKEIANSA